MWIVREDALLPGQRGVAGARRTLGSRPGYGTALLPPRQRAHLRPSVCYSGHGHIAAQCELSQPIGRRKHAPREIRCVPTAADSQLDVRERIASVVLLELIDSSVHGVLVAGLKHVRRERGDPNHDDMVFERQREQIVVKEDLDLLALAIHAQQAHLVIAECQPLALLFERRENGFGVVFLEQRPLDR